MKQNELLLSAISNVHWSSILFLDENCHLFSSCKGSSQKIGRKEKKWRLQQQIDSIQFLLLIFDFAIPKLHFINQKNWLKMFSKNEHNFYVPFKWNCLMITKLDKGAIHIWYPIFWGHFWPTYLPISESSTEECLFKTSDIRFS